MDWILMTIVRTVTLIFVFIGFILLWLFFLILRKLLPTKIKRMDYSGRIAECVGAVGFHQADFIDAYKSSIEEHLIFLRNGLITDREGIIYIPFQDISSVTKELYKNAYLVTVVADISGRGCVVLEERRSGKYPLVEVKRKLVTDKELLSLKKSFDEDGGVVVFENINPEAMGLIEKSFKRAGIAVSQIPCKVKRD